MRESPRRQLTTLVIQLLMEDFTDLSAGLRDIIITISGLRWTLVGLQRSGRL